MATTRKKGARKKKAGSVKATRKRSRAQAKRGRGQPRVDFNLEDLRKLSQVGCTNATMASILGTSKATLQRRIADTPDVAKAIEDGRASMERNLRTAQLRSAIGGNATMMIWLGKQLLGQRDVRAVELTGTGGGPMEFQADLKPVLEEKLKRFIRSRSNGAG